KLLKDEIDSKDYKEVKEDCEKRARLLEARLIEVSQKAVNISGTLKKVLEALPRLGQFYDDGNNIIKRKVVSSIFPEKIIYTGKTFRTPRLNAAIKLIYKLDKAF